MDKQTQAVKEVVKGYFNANAHNTIPSFVYLSDDDTRHIIDIGTSILCTKWDIGYPGGSFVQAVVNNDLMGAFSTADRVNVQALRFYVLLMYNVSMPRI
jgi:hypothetical protein